MAIVARIVGICSALLAVGFSAQAGILPPGATPTRLATGYVFTEGPLYDRAGGVGVYFEDMHPSGQVATNPSHIVRYNIATGIASVVDPSSGGANGDYLNANGQVVTADRERRQISLRSAGNISIVQQALATTYNGTPFNGPNDLVIDSVGGIYFTDPDYENRRSLPDAVYYRNPAGVVSRLLTGFFRPNGVILSPSGTTFYLAVEGENRIMAYDVTAPGILTNQRQFARTDVNPDGTTIPGITNGPDGLTIDPAGNIYAAVQNAVWAWNPAGQQLFQLPFPEDPTNLEFGGADGKTLFVTAGRSLYDIRLNIVPEPASLELCLAGLGLLALGWRFRARMTALATIALVFGLWSSAARAESDSPPSLKAATAGLFRIGVAARDHIAARPSDWPLLMSQFNSVTPENCLKPDPVQVAEGKFNFTEADAFVDFATAHHLEIVGHCLVWAKDDRTPPWFLHDGQQPAGRDLVLARMKKHIETVVGRYKGRIAMWDVVNEALDDGSDFLRPSGWSRACGEEFIAKAFEFAHAADPDALLIYNDYNDELPAKRAKLIRLVRSLKAKNVPIHAVGLQGHYEIDHVPFADLETTLTEMHKLGVKVVVSELDMDVIPRSRWWAEGGKYRDELSKLDPYRESCPSEVLQRQAEQYAQLFRLFRKHADTIIRVTFWNLHDGQSWLNGFPWRRVNYPLLFDRYGEPKPAFSAVIKALKP